MSDLSKNTWALNGWYDQTVAGTGGYIEDDTMWSWGTNTYGRLGQSQPSNKKESSPVQIPGTTWSKVATGNPENWSLVQKNDGTLWSWGGNGYGHLGHNSVIACSSPVQMPGNDTAWSKICTGSRHWLGIKTNGTMWSCGSNQFGELGDGESVGPGEYPGTKYSYSSPIQLPGTWSDISSGTNRSYGIQTNGTLWCWGYNQHAALGLNEQYSPHKSSPTQIYGGGTNWAKLATTADKFMAAIKTDGTLWAWGGAQNTGNLGHRHNPNSGINSRSSPVQIPGTTWTEVATTYNSIYGLKTDGTLWGWGENDEGQMGQNSRTQYSSPVQITSGTDWATIRGSMKCLFARNTSGSLFAIGSGSQGQRDSSTVASTSSPVVIGGASWKDMGSGRYATIGIREW